MFAMNVIWIQVSVYIIAPANCVLLPTLFYTHCTFLSALICYTFCAVDTDILKISKITWNYLHFFYKISKNLKAFIVSHASNDPQQLSLAPGLPPAKSGRACYDNPTGRGYFYQMSNMYTCIAYLTEIRKFCSKKPGS